MDLNNMEKMRGVDIRNVEKESLVDLNVVQIDDTKPVHDRVSSFLKQIENPYCFRVGDVIVKVKYRPDGPTFQQRFEELLKTT